MIQRWGFTVASVEVYMFALRRGCIFDLLLRLPDEAGQDLGVSLSSKNIIIIAGI